MRFYTTRFIADGLEYIHARMLLNFDSKSHKYHHLCIKCFFYNPFNFKPIYNS